MEPLPEQPRCSRGGAAGPCWRQRMPERHSSPRSSSICGSTKQSGGYISTLGGPACGQAAQIGRKSTHLLQQQHIAHAAVMPTQVQHEAMSAAGRQQRLAVGPACRCGIRNGLAAPLNQPRAANGRSCGGVLQPLQPLQQAAHVEDRCRHPRQPASGVQRCSCAPAVQREEERIRRKSGTSSVWAVL